MPLGGASAPWESVNALGSVSAPWGASCVSALWSINALGSVMRQRLVERLRLGECSVSASGSFSATRTKNIPFMAKKPPKSV
jgi:hypothetical protein